MKDLKLTVVEGEKKFFPVRIEFTVTTIEELVGLWHRMNLNDFKTGYGPNHGYNIEASHNYKDYSHQLYEVIDDHLESLGLRHLVYKDGRED